MAVVSSPPPSRVQRLMGVLGLVMAAGGAMGLLLAGLF